MEMTDRELLELAAKAAGIDTAVLSDENDGASGRWNPLEDDGDALRLAVKLFITVAVEEGYTDAVSIWKAHREEHDGDPCAATRRAIVRAAAVIGEQMK